MWDLHVTLCGWQYSRLGTNIKIAVTIFKHTFSVNLFFHPQTKKKEHCSSKFIPSIQDFFWRGGWLLIRGGCLFKVGLFFNKYGTYMSVWLGMWDLKHFHQ